MPDETHAQRIKRLIPGKRYLGDGCYVESSGWGVAVDLTTSDGQNTTNRIELEPDTMRQLQAFVTELTAGVEALTKELNDARDK